MTDTQSQLKKTALFEEHTRLNGRMVDFGGWGLPVQYSGVKDEHLACRQAAGLFDVSHMGEFHVEGPGAESFLDWAVTNSVTRLQSGDALYTVFCHDHGGIIDDLVIYRRSADRFLVVVNASNTAKDFAAMERSYSQWRLLPVHNGDAPAVRLENVSQQYTQIAIQGPRAVEILQTLTQTPLAPIKTYGFAEGTVLNQIPAILARTGYTGEDGFEVYVPWASGPAVWRALLDAGQPLGLKPCGLGARDTLRLEMKYPLYGNEITDETHPLEAGLGWVVKMDKPDFQGKSALAAQQIKGLSRKLVGFKMLDRGIPRHGYTLHSDADGPATGIVTSGTQAPSLDLAVGIGYLPIALSKPGSRAYIDIRGTKLPIEVVATPFYKKSKPA